MISTYTIQLSKTLKPFAFSKRHFWHWLNLVFNKVDEDRRRTVGPDRSCAEWLLRNGASVRWTTSSSEDFLTDYNSLPPESTRVYIRDVDATESSIMHYGFGHFDGCKHIEGIIFHKCDYLEDSALSMLTPLNTSLKRLQISECGNLTQPGLLNLTTLINLEKLSLFNLMNVKDVASVVKELQDKLPNCVIGHDDLRRKFNNKL